MKRVYWLRLSIVSLFVLNLNSQSSLAFSVTPSSPGATFRYQPESTYRFGGSEWVTEITEDIWFEPLPLGGTSRLINTLNLLWAPRATPPFGQGWNFQSASQDLEGSFNIATYYACAFQEPCGGPTGVGPRGNEPDFPRRSTNGVGSVIGLEYNPVGSDPRPKGSNLHWIQVVESNLTRLPFIDNNGRFDTPYYDRPTDDFATGDYFIDRPYFFRPTSPGTPNFFSADVYLVEEITLPTDTPRQVKIYNGVRWGWQNIDDDCEFKPFLDAEVCYGGGPDFDEIGLTQDDPILPDVIDNGSKFFNDKPSDRWFDPPTPFGFEFQVFKDTLFTGITDFPLMADNSFTVAVGDTILGEFGPGDSIDFVSLFGQGIPNFSITNIDSPFDDTAFPIKLTFNNSTGSFRMFPLGQPQSVPEPNTVFSLLALGLLGIIGLNNRK